MDETDRLAAIAAIRALKARYCRLLDTRDWQGWAALFAPDAVMDVSDDVKPGVGEPEITGRDAIVGQVRAIVGKAVTVHQVMEPEITILDSHTATGIWPMQDKVLWEEGVESPIPARIVRGFGWYHERYERGGDCWRIARLKLVRQHVDFR